MYYCSSFFVILLFSSISFCSIVPQKISGGTINLKTNAPVHSSGIFKFVIGTPIITLIWGSKATEKQFPYQISLQHFYRGAWHHKCGGSIYNTRYIITAAFCVINESGNRLPVDSLSIVAGTIFLNGTGTRYNVSKTIPHERYSRFHLLKNIALLQTSSSITFTDAIMPVTLNTAFIPPFRRVTVSGWGGTFLGGDLLFDTLQYTHSFTAIYLPGASELCTATGGKCYGDYGGPLVLAGTRELVGIVSYSTPGCLAPDIFTRVSSYVDWIKSNAVL